MVRVRMFWWRHIVWKKNLFLAFANLFSISFYLHWLYYWFKWWEKDEKGDVRRVRRIYNWDENNFIKKVKVKGNFYFVKNKWNRKILDCRHHWCCRKVKQKICFFVEHETFFLCFTFFFTLKFKYLTNF